MPAAAFGPEYRFLQRDELLTYEEIARLAALFAACGVVKVRLTGGEPLLRRDLPRLVAMLSKVAGIRDLALTTNGVLLAEQAAALKRAGLGRVTVSLDALEEDLFQAMSGVGAGVGKVLAGIEAAAAAGLAPVKINAVVRRGVNDRALVPLARRFRGTGQILRLIEYMDVGNTNGWRLDQVVPAAEMIARIGKVFPLEPLEPRHPGEVAQRWGYRDGGGEIGVIAAVSQPFCHACSRARLSPEGQLYTCLFAAQGVNLRGLMRAGADDETLSAAISAVWRARVDRYSEQRTAATCRRPKIEMSYIGG